MSGTDVTREDLERLRREVDALKPRDTLLEPGPTLAQIGMMQEQARRARVAVAAKAAERHAAGAKRLRPLQGKRDRELQTLRDRITASEHRYAEEMQALGRELVELTHRPLED
jgi:hypothetical protein